MLQYLDPKTVLIYRPHPVYSISMQRESWPPSPHMKGSLFSGGGEADLIHSTKTDSGGSSAMRNWPGRARVAITADG
jgi:hypothetical protein